MRIAVLGAGRIGAFHAELLARSPEVTELLVGDPDNGRGRALADKVGGRYVEDLAAALATGPPDGVVIATPTSTHAELIHTSLDLGIPVFCEKPIALEVPATRKVVSHAAATGVPLQVGFQRRFDAGYRAARDAYASGTLGRVHTLRAVTADPAPPHPGYIPMSGGQFRDMHIHDFDAIRFVTKREVLAVLAAGSNVGADFFREAGDVDTTAAILRLDDGAVAVVTGTRYNGAGCDVRLEVSGTAATVVAGLDDHAPLRSAEPDVPWPFEAPYQGFLQRFAAAYQSELAGFLDYARGRIHCPCSAEDALAALLIAEAAELSRREGRAVTIAEVDR